MIPIGDNNQWTYTMYDLDSLGNKTGVSSSRTLSVFPELAISIISVGFRCKGLVFVHNPKWGSIFKQRLWELG